MNRVTIINQKKVQSPESNALRIAHSSIHPEGGELKSKEVHLLHTSQEIITVKSPEIKRSFRYYPDGPMGNYQGL